MAEEGSLLGLYETSLAVVGSVGMGESRSDFQGECETRRVLPSPSFPATILPPLSWSSQTRGPQPLEQFAFGLLHTLGGFGIAKRCGDALQSGDGEARALRGDGS